MTTATGLNDVNGEYVGTVGLHGLLAQVEEGRACP